MTKTKFRYNPKTLSYEKVKRSMGERILRRIIFIAPTIVLSLVFAFFIAYRINSPKKVTLKKKLAKLKTKYALVQEQIKIVNQVAEVIKQHDEELYRTALKAKEFPKKLRLINVKNNDAYSSYKNKSNNELLIQTFSKLDELKRKL